MEELKERTSGFYVGCGRVPVFKTRPKPYPLVRTWLSATLQDNKGRFPICHGKKSNIKETRTVKSCPGISWTAGKGPEASVTLLESQDSQSEWYSAGTFPPCVQNLVNEYSLPFQNHILTKEREEEGFQKSKQLPLTCTWG